MFAYNHTIDLKNFVQQKHVPLYENTCSLSELDEKPNNIKISKFYNFDKQDYKKN